MLERRSIMPMPTFTTSPIVAIATISEPVGEFAGA